MNFKTPATLVSSLLNSLNALWLFPLGAVEFEEQQLSSTRIDLWWSMSLQCQKNTIRVLCSQECASSFLIWHRPIYVHNQRPVTKGFLSGWMTWKMEPQTLPHRARANSLPRAIMSRILKPISWMLNARRQICYWLFSSGLLILYPQWYKLKDTSSTVRLVLVRTDVAKFFAPSFPSTKQFFQTSFHMYMVLKVYVADQLRTEWFAGWTRLRQFTVQSKFFTPKMFSVVSIFPESIYVHSASRWYLLGLK